MEGAHPARSSKACQGIETGTAIVVSLSAKGFARYARLTSARLSNTSLVPRYTELIYNAPPMDLRRVKAFIAVAETLSVTKAAERLHISQPPLSRHIHQLEEELGVMLFVRHRYGVTLTDAGQRLLEKARLLDAAASEFAS